MIKNYVGFSLDMSGSMSSLTGPAKADYERQIASLREAASVNSDPFGAGSGYREPVDTIVSVVFNGIGSPARVERHLVNCSLGAVPPLQRYSATGTSTPLFDSVGELIEIFEALPDARDPNVAFLITVITDGYENGSIKWDARRLARKMAELSATDRWTFVFRVPRNHARGLTANFGIPPGNVLEWDQTREGMEVASQMAAQSVGSYYDGLRRGVRSTKGFFTDLSNVDPATIKSEK